MGLHESCLYHDIWSRNVTKSTLIIITHLHNDVKDACLSRVVLLPGACDRFCIVMSCVISDQQPSPAQCCQSDYLWVCGLEMLTWWNNDGSTNKNNICHITTQDVVLSSVVLAHVYLFTSAFFECVISGHPEIQIDTRTDYKYTWHLHA